MHVPKTYRITLVLQNYSMICCSDSVDETGNLMMAYNSREPSNKQLYWKDGDIVTEEYKYNDKTIELPIVTPQEEEVTICTSILTDSANHIRSYEASWNWKVDVLERPKTIQQGLPFSTVQRQVQ
mmetsp:Transcript_10671/g.19574  ORF Transcript_10671/g.19574 Transcript_10671/m.19574 type:complete len:125 (-) Transcript_10671:757-1131(-)